MKTTTKANLEVLGTWRKYHQGMCDSCKALCCHLPTEATVDDLVRLEFITEFDKECGEKHILKILKGDKRIQHYSRADEKFTLAQKSDGSCIYLKNYRCEVYDKRPETCRSHPQKGPRPGYCPYDEKSV